MGVIKVSQTFRTKVTPNRMFKALILDSHNLAPQLMFSSIKNVEILEGTGGPGTIKQINFTEGVFFNILLLELFHFFYFDFVTKESFMIFST